MTGSQLTDTRQVVPRAVDLFAGIGGVTLGLKLAGFTVLGAIDNDPLAAETYSINHPEVRLWPSDIREVDPVTLLQELRLEPGDLCLLAGCPPCQGFSSIRTLNGGRDVYDDRNDLLFEFLRFVEVLRPKVVMLENVPGLRQDRRFLEFVLALRVLGYRPGDQVLDAFDFGVPQRRKRLIVLAGLGREMSFPVCSVGERATVRAALGTLPPPGLAGDPLHDLPENRSPRIMALIADIQKDGGSRSGLPSRRWLQCHRKCDGFYDVYGRMAWDAPAPTITGGCINPSKGRFLHPDQDRAITLREAALLQSFPVDYAVSLRRGKYEAARLIGNALPPALIEAIAGAVARQICEPWKG